MRKRLTRASYIRSFTFGVEDSLVSTVGLLSGVAIASTSVANVLFTGIIYIFVEAFSMSVGSFLSELSSEEYMANNKEVGLLTSFIDAIIMFLSFIIAGFIPLSPYIFAGGNMAMPWSIFLSLFTLFILGVIDAHMTKTNLVKKGLQMLVIGGVAILVGVIIGRAFHV